MREFKTIPPFDLARFYIKIYETETTTKLIFIYKKEIKKTVEGCGAK